MYSAWNRLFSSRDHTTLKALWAVVTAWCLIPSAAAANRPAPLRIFGQPVEIINGAIHFTGKITHSTPGVISTAKGAIQLAASIVRWPSARKPLYTLHQVGLTGNIRYDNTAPPMKQLTLTGGAFKIADFNWTHIQLDKISGMAKYSQGKLVITSCHGMYRNHPWTLSADYNSERGTLSVNLQMTKINQQRIFQFFVPSKLNVIGPATLTAHFTWHRNGHVTGKLSLKAVGPGMLEIKSVPILTQRVVQAYGQSMAMLMIEDLREYPFIGENLTATENAQGMIIRYSFIRGTGNPQKLKPQMIKIDGRKVLFRPRDLKSYSNTIRLPGTGIRKLLKLSHEFTHPDRH